MSDPFPADYRSGRRAFLSAAVGLDTITRMHPQATGRDGKPLFVDTVVLGPRGAEDALLVLSGTHGVEGYFGSGVLTAVLRENRFADGAQRIVLVHALNPFGFSFDRRADENNIDINRNFVDFARVPENPDYDRLADAVALADLSDAHLAAADAALNAFAARHGEEALQTALAAGQYRHPDGLCYGGIGFSWSAGVLFDLLREELKGVRRLTVLDLHTGLGGFGESRIICDAPADSADFARVRALWPEAVSSASPGAVATPAYGLIGDGLAGRVERLTFATLEIGTLPLAAVFDALRRDLWLHNVAGRTSPAAGAVAAAMRAAFFPDDPAWRAAALDAGLAAIAAACGGI